MKSIISQISEELASVRALSLPFEQEDEKISEQLELALSDADEYREVYLTKTRLVRNSLGEKCIFV